MGEPRAASDVRLNFLAHEPALRRRALRLARVRDAQHLVHDTLDCLLRSHDQSVHGEHLSVWLFTVMGQLYVERCRRQPKLRDCDEVPAPPTPPRWALTTRARFGAALDLLPPDFRRVFVLHAVHGLSYDEIAVQLGMTRRAVFARLVRSRLLLKDMLAELLEGEEREGDRGL